MTKILRYASVIALTFLSSLTFAQTTITFTAGTDMGANDNAGVSGDKVTKDGITIETTSGNSAFAAAQYRFAKNSVSTFTSTIGNITKIEFTCTAAGDAKYGPGCFTVDEGTYTYNGKAGTWAGNATSATFTASSNQVRATQIVVTVGGSTDPTPDPTPDPTVSFTDYTIAGLNGLRQDVSNVRLALSNAKVVYVNGNTASVREGNKAVLFYSTGLSLIQNATIDGTVKVDYDNYYGVHEVKKNDYTNADSLTVTTSSDKTLDATATTLAEIKSLNHIADLVKVEDVTIVKVGNDYFAVSGTDSVQTFNNVVDMAGYEDQTVTIYAVFNNIYKNKPEVSVVAVEGESVQEETAANIAEFKQKATTATLTLTNAHVLYAGDNDIYVRDATGAIDFYKSKYSWKPNQVLNGTIKGTYAVFRNLPEFTNPTDSNISVTDGAAAEAHAVGIDELSVEGYACDLVQISDVTLKKITSGKNTNVYAYSADGDSIQVYDKFNLVKGQFVDEQTYTIKGIIVPYNDVLEICPIEDYTNGATPEPTIITADNIAAFKTLENNTTATLKLKDAQVVYTWTSNKGNVQTYVRDATGALLFYNTGLPLEQNQLLNGTVSLKLNVYNNLPEATKADDTNTDNLTITEGAVSEPKLITVDEVATNVSNLVVINDIQVAANEAGDRYYAVSDTDSLQIYDGFHLTDYSINTTASGETTSVKGIIAQYKTTFEIYPVENVVTGINDFTKAKILDLNAAVYNLAGQKVRVSFKGIVIKNGKKYIQK